MVATAEMLEGKSMLGCVQYRIDVKILNTSIKFTVRQNKHEVYHAKPSLFSDFVRKLAKHCIKIILCFLP